MILIDPGNENWGIESSLINFSKSGSASKIERSHGNIHEVMEDNILRKKEGKNYSKFCLTQFICKQMVSGL